METRQAKVLYRTTPPQAAFMEALFKHRLKRVCLLGGIKSGKTYIGARAMFRYIMENRGKEKLMWIVAPTYPMSLVPEREIMKIFSGLPQGLIKKIIKNEHAYEFWNGIRVEIKSADDPNKLRAANVDVIWIDEGAYISEEAYNILLGRVLATEGIIYITTTPNGINNWVYNLFYKRALEDKNYCIIFAPTASNIFLDTVEISNLYSVYSKELAMQELEAEFVELKGLVFKDFKSLNIKNPEDLSGRIYCGIDWGYSTPFVCIYVLQRGKELYVVDEIYETGLTIHEIIIKLKLHPLRDRVELYVCDSADPEKIEELKRNGFGAIKAFKDILVGIQRVAGMFEFNRLFISPKCINLIKELNTYCWKDDKKDKPIDINNHAVDALRYVIATLYDMINTEIEVVKEIKSPSIVEEVINKKLRGTYDNSIDNFDFARHS